MGEKKLINDIVSEFKVIHENISQMAYWDLPGSSTSAKASPVLLRGVIRTGSLLED